jgi:hypothetical protein
VAHLHGKISLTKLSFGVSSGMLSRAKANNDIESAAAIKKEKIING